MMSARTSRRAHLSAVTAIVGAVALAVSSIGPAGAADSSTPPIAVLDERDEAFWDGSLSASVPDAALCPAAEGTACIEYGIELTESGWRLRVALDRAYGGGGDFSLSLLDPSGEEHATSSERVRDAFQAAAGFYSVELFAESPVPGRWTARVTARSVTPDGLYRMRAKLEPEPKAHRHPRPLLPNLRPIPPFEVTFSNPTPDSSNGCRSDEQRDYGARRCLRFSTGPANVGDGLLDLRYAGAALEGDAIQRIHSSDGTSTDVPAGTFHYHVAHAHYHHDGIGQLELFRFDPATREMSKVSDGPKVGYCMGDYLIAEWDRFDQDPVRDLVETLVGCGVYTGPNGAGLGLVKGWGDVYVWQTPGNYVELATRPTASTSCG